MAISTEQAEAGKSSATVFVAPGTGGWGKGLYLKPSGQKKKVASITAGGTHPVAIKIGELLNCEVVNSFSEKVDLEEMICVVIDCGGTARMGIYPMKQVPTINVKQASPSGPLVSYITEDIFVSGVTVTDVEVSNGKGNGDSEIQSDETRIEPSSKVDPIGNSNPMIRRTGPIEAMAKAISNALGLLYQSGKDAVIAFVSHVLPLMIGISVIIGLINYFSLDQFLSSITIYSLGSFLGILIISILFAIPAVSQYLGAGAILGQVLVVILGYEVATEHIGVIWLIPALFAIDMQVGCDFLPTGLSLSKSKKETVQAGVKAVLYSRLLTSVICVAIGYFVSRLAGF